MSALYAALVCPIGTPAGLLVPGAMRLGFEYIASRFVPGYDMIVPYVWPLCVK